MSNKPISETETIRAAIERLRSSLPPRWSLEVDMEPIGPDRGIDAVLSLRGAEGGAAQVFVESKHRIEPRLVPGIVEQIRGFSKQHWLVVAPFLSARTRQSLRQQGISYADATGNLLLVLEQPAVWVERTGATENPWHEARALRSLKGGKAGRVVRALCDFRPPYGVRELAERSRTTPAAISRVASVLESEALLTKDPRGRIADVDWQGTLRRWTDDYRVLTTNHTVSYLEPRGLPHLLHKLRQFKGRYVVTGSLAAARRSTVAPARLATVYVDEVAEAGRELGLRAIEAGANVMLLMPFDEVVFDRAAEDEGVLYAAPSQVAADLVTSPGRGPEEGEALLTWMKEHEDVWRH